MDKQKEIEEMAKLCCYPCEMYSGFTEKCAEGTRPNQCGIAIEAAKKLINAGYGNIEQALTEFAERLKEKVFLPCYKGTIDETLKEFLK